MSTGRITVDADALVAALRPSSEFSKAAMAGVAFNLLHSAGFTLKPDFPVPATNPTYLDVDVDVDGLDDMEALVQCRGSESDIRELFLKLCDFNRAEPMGNFHGKSLYAQGKCVVETDVSYANRAGMYYFIAEIKKASADIQDSKGHTTVSSALCQLAMDYFKACLGGVQFAQTTYGVVTNGKLWQFARFRGKEISYSECFDVTYGGLKSHKSNEVSVLSAFQDRVSGHSVPVLAILAQIKAAAAVLAPVYAPVEFALPPHD